MGKGIINVYEDTLNLRLGFCLLPLNRDDHYHDRYDCQIKKINILSIGE